jgi:hypothetical protein
MDQIRKRGPALTIFLGMVSGAAILALATYAFTWKVMLIKSPAWAVYTLFGLTVLRTASLVLIWLWSKTGVVSWTLLTIVAIPIYLYAGYKLSFLGLLGIALMWLLVRGKWQQMQWGFR